MMMTLDRQKIGTLLNSVKSVEGLIPESVYHEIQESEDEDEILYIKVILKNAVDAHELNTLRTKLASIIHHEMPIYVPFSFQNEAWKHWG